MSVINTALAEHLGVIFTGLELTFRASLCNAILHILGENSLDALPGRLHSLAMLIATGGDRAGVLLALTSLAVADALNATRDLLIPTASDRSRPLQAAAGAALQAQLGQLHVMEIALAALGHAF